MNAEENPAPPARPPAAPASLGFESDARVADFPTRNAEMQRCVEMARAATRTTACVLIIGEAGVGKKTLAQAIHNDSPRAAGPCLEISCIGQTADSFERELFGQAASADALGSERGRKGRLALAREGTLLITGIQELSLAMQGHILRLLETGCYSPIDSTGRIRADVRIIAIASSDPREAIAGGTFRSDLLLRLGEITLRIPPLRERREDLNDLIDYALREGRLRFGRRAHSISRIARDYLLRYAWPGNLRELKSFMTRALTMSEDEQLWLEDFGMRVEFPTEFDAQGNMEPVLSLEAMERRHIQVVLDYTRGNKKRAALLLQVSRPTLDRKIQIYNLRIP